MQVDNVALFGALDATYVTSGQRLPVTYTHTLARGHTHTHTNAQYNASRCLFKRSYRPGFHA